MDGGEVHSQTANATAADLVNGLVFMCCLLFKRKWYWLVLFQQTFSQTLWLSRWCLGIICFSYPGIDDPENQRSHKRYEQPIIIRGNQRQSFG